MRRQSRRSVNICKYRKRSGVARVLVSQIVASSTRIRQMEIQAYFEEWSRRPGDTVRLAISTPHASIHASLVRLTSGPGQGDSIEGRVTDFSSVLDTTVPGRIQATMVGSYAELSLPAATGRLVSVHCWVWPTVPERAAPQAVWSLGDIALVTASGGIELRSKTNVVAFIPNAVVGKHWYSILVTIGDGELSIDLKRLDGKVSSHHTVRTTTTMTTSSETLILAASGVGPSGSPLLPFNGKIDSPTLYLEKPNADTIAAWHAGNVQQAAAWAAWKLGEDFAAETISTTLKDVPPGRLVNGVERGVTGRNWDGRSGSFTETPQQYCALQFHDDDMGDAGWSYDIEFALPDTLRSGVYAVRLESYPLPAVCRPQDGNDSARAVSDPHKHLPRLRQRPSRLARLFIGHAARQGGTRRRTISFLPSRAGAILLRYLRRRHAGTLFQAPAAAVQCTSRLSQLADRLLPSLSSRHVHRRMARACRYRIPRRHGRGSGARGPRID